MDLEPASYLCCGLLTFECLKGYLSLKGGAVLLATLLLLLLLRAYFVILGAGTDLSYLSEILGPSQLSEGKYFSAETADDLLTIYEDVDLRFEVKSQETEIMSILGGVSMFALLIGGLLSLTWFGRMP